MATTVHFSGRTTTTGAGATTCPRHSSAKSRSVRLGLKPPCRSARAVPCRAAPCRALPRRAAPHPAVPRRALPCPATWACPDRRQTSQILVPILCLHYSCNLPPKCKHPAAQYYLAMPQSATNATVVEANRYAPFACPPLFCAMGKTSTLCAWLPVCRDGIAVIKFTKSRQLPRHRFDV